MNNTSNRHLNYRCGDIVLGCTHDIKRYTGRECCDKFFGKHRYASDLATLCISTHQQEPLEELFASQIYGFTAYLKTRTADRFGIVNRFGIVAEIARSIAEIKLE